MSKKAIFNRESRIQLAGFTSKIHVFECAACCVEIKVDHCLRSVEIIATMHHPDLPDQYRQIGVYEISQKSLISDLEWLLARLKSLGVIIVMRGKQ